MERLKTFLFLPCSSSSATKGVVSYTGAQAEVSLPSMQMSTASDDAIWTFRASLDSLLRAYYRIQLLKFTLLTVRDPAARWLEYGQLKFRLVAELNAGTTTG